MKVTGIDVSCKTVTYIRVVPFVNLLIYENILGFGRQD